ncbi:MAG TPA: ATP-binding protein [Rhodopila sp.]|uniref:sensor histidine kinase n=1 Tax=Rhodopila sp. TaxID=2480087 RepID=UPI002B65BF5B|nr:ATP-binding protein [Rhodopila sp.]HVY17282.1 ATP-binding protein [Rhodopila sp.]
MRLVGLASCLAGAPILVLSFIAVLGWTDAWAAVAAMAVTAASAGVFTLLWLRDLDLLTDSVRQVGTEEPGPTLDGTQALMMEPLGREIERLSRRLSVRAAQQAQHRRADTLILERLPDPVIVIADDRSVRRTNAAARIAFGDDMAAVLRHPALRAAIERGLGTGQVQVAEFGLRAPISRDVIANVVPMDPPLADGGQILVVLSDRTRERVVERMRADFVANVSHELRTPLASVIGFIETLQGPARDDPDAQQRFLAIMAEQGARMNRLIDDLLNLSRVELTEHQPPSDPVDLAALMTRIAAGFEPRLAQRRTTLDLRVPPDLPHVIGDADQLAQVLQNLLDNGLKYGRDGGVLMVTASMLAGPGQSQTQAQSQVLAARSETDPEAPSLPASPTPTTRPWPNRPGVVVSVSDQGFGIPKEHLPRLTERFYRVDKGRSRAIGGTGLGLAIVKHIVNRHRGQLQIESEENVGTTVSVWLPTAAVAAKMADAD